MNPANLDKNRWTYRTVYALMRHMTPNEDRKYVFLTCLKCGDEYPDQDSEAVGNLFSSLLCKCGHVTHASYLDVEDVWVMTEMEK